MRWWGGGTAGAAGAAWRPPTREREAEEFARETLAHDRKLAKLRHERELLEEEARLKLARAQAREAAEEARHRQEHEHWMREQKRQLVEARALNSEIPALRKIAECRDKRFNEDATDDDVVRFSEKAGMEAREPEHVNLSACLKVTDEGIKALARNCPQLNFVDFSGTGSQTNENLTDEAVKELARHCPQLNSTFYTVNFPVLSQAKSLRDLACDRRGGGRDSDSASTAVKKEQGPTDMSVMQLNGHLQATRVNPTRVRWNRAKS